MAFEDFWFAYPARPELLVLRGLSLEVPTGFVTAAVELPESADSAAPLRPRRDNQPRGLRWCDASGSGDGCAARRPLPPPRTAVPGVSAGAPPPAIRVARAAARRHHSSDGGVGDGGVGGDDCGGCSRSSGSSRRSGRDRSRGSGSGSGSQHRRQRCDRRHTATNVFWQSLLGGGRTGVGRGVDMHSAAPSRLRRAERWKWRR